MNEQLQQIGVPLVRPPVAQASHLPADFYVSPEIYQLEKENIFLKEWLCVGRQEEIPKPGDYFTFSIVDRPIVVARGEDGQLTAFLAICRHRGALVATGRGNVSRFKCPFHAWTYDLCGRLVGAPFMEESEGFDRAGHGLVPLRVQVWGGFIFVNFDLDAPDFLAALGDFGPYVEGLRTTYRFDELRLGKRFETTLDANWKILFEQFSDHYHVSLLHTQSMEKVQPMKGFGEDRIFRNGVTNYFRGGLAPTFDGKPRLSAMEWLSGKELEGGHIVHIYPNMTIVARVDSVTYLVTWPQGVSRATYLGHFLFQAKAFELPQFQQAVSDYMAYCNQILTEDIEVIASVQRALTSGAFQPGRMSKYEGLINATLGYFLRKIGETGQQPVEDARQC